MSALRWKIRRLLAMSPDEVALRAMRVLRERFQPLPKETPEQTWRRYYPDVAPRAALTNLHERLNLRPNAIPESERAEVLAEADALLQGRWTLFGYPVQLDDPPRWTRNYVLGKDWMDAPAKAIDYRRIDVAGGVKYVWEPSRGLPILRLATAYALSPDARYAETALRWLTDWIERNPRGWSIHWTSALEHAIRVFAWSYTLVLLGEAVSDTDAGRVLGALLQHAEFIERHLSPGSSANNHLIGEAAALAFLGRALPEQPTVQRWAQTGFRTLEREAMRQFFDDGVNAEQGFGYLPFVWEFYLHPYRLQPLPSAVAVRLQRNLDFVRHVMDASGYVPQVGDEDDGTVVPLWSAQANRYRVVGRALAMMLHTEPPPALMESDDALCLWLFGSAPAGGSRITESRLYPDGGYAVLHATRWQVLFDAGPLGLGSLAAHGHADALSVWASIDGKPLLVDAGTYAYHEDPEWRNHFRGTPAHNTLTLDNCNQAEILGAFLWGKRARSEFTACDMRQNTVGGATDAYTPDRVERRVQLQGDQLRITDTLEWDAAHSAQWRWHFHPAWQVQPDGEGAWRITDGRLTVRLTLAGLTGYTTQVHYGDEASKLGWYSPRFGHKTPCATLEVEKTPLGEPLTVEWRFEPV
ncbi:MAG: hypothetical protein KatS3mg020_0953 [Fimbriimonadales bacterium]|nr:MAG: hypothetical protein KatS3mg020_0953 [Fimbriimonadales bacterium]